MAGGSPSKTTEDRAALPKSRLRDNKYVKIVFGAICAFSLGVYDNIKGGAVSATANWIRYQWGGSVYVVELSDAVLVSERGVTLRPVGEPNRTIRPDRVSVTRVAGTELVRYLAISVYPGHYFVTLERTSSDGMTVLNEQPILFGKPEEIGKINTSASQWSSSVALTTLPAGSGSVSGGASGTRWVAAPSDSEALAAASGKLSIVLRQALGQLGVWEKGSEAELAAIDAYWAAARAAGGTPQVSRSDTIWGLWGGAFVAWAVAQSGSAPPSNAAAFRSWLSWGVAVEPSKASPGMIVIVETGQRQAPTPSGLMVGVYLRTRVDCVEMITGNMANRVAVTCVRGTARSFRVAS